MLLLRFTIFYFQLDISIDELIFNRYSFLLSFPFWFDFFHFFNPYFLGKYIFNFLSHKNKITLDNFISDDKKFPSNVFFMEGDRKRHWDAIIGESSGTNKRPTLDLNTNPNKNPRPEVIAGPSRIPDSILDNSEARSDISRRSSINFENLINPDFANNYENYTQEFPNEKNEWINIKDDFHNKVRNFSITSVYFDSPKGKELRSTLIYPSEDERIKLYSDNVTVNKFLSDPKPKVGFPDSTKNIAGWILITNNATYFRFQLNGDKHRLFLLKELKEVIQLNFNGIEEMTHIATLNHLSPKAKDIISEFQSLNNENIDMNMSIKSAQDWLDKRIYKERNRILDSEKLLKARDSQIYKHLIKEFSQKYKSTNEKIESWGGEEKFGKHLYKTQVYFSRELIKETYTTTRKVGILSEDRYFSLKKYKDWQ